MGCCIIWGQNWSLERKRTNYCCFPITVLILWGRINEINILHSNLHDDGSYTKEINAEGTEYPKKHACECFFTYMLVNRASRIEKWHKLQGTSSFSTFQPSSSRKNTSAATYFFFTNYCKVWRLFGWDELSELF